MGFSQKIGISLAIVDVVSCRATRGPVETKSVSTNLDRWLSLNNWDESIGVLVLCMSIVLSGILTGEWSR
jgi:hypothetical protein